MAASMINVFVLEYSYPGGGQPPTDTSLNSPFFTLPKTSNDFQTLSQNIGNSGADVQGFLYVPTFASGDPCGNLSAAYVPQNITTISKIPPMTDFPSVAFVPWLSNTSCVFEYLQAANSNKVRAMITYLPGRKNLGDYNAAAAPNVTDQAWSLGDNDQWKNNFGFPVYAMNSNDGSVIMSMLSNYSGDIGSVQYGSTLVSHYGPSATARLYVEATIFSYPQLPSLWVFLLIVVGVLIGVLLFASVTMRIVHRRRRRELARMIASGDVDLAGLGISRVQVTKDVLEKMPLYIYVAHGEQAGSPHAPRREGEGEGEAEADAADAAQAQASGGKAVSKVKSLYAGFRSKKPAAAASAPPTAELPAVLDEKAVSFPLDTCVICLDDFTNHSTAVRWLPCGHVFHPACIDPLLLEYSSLCPTCKASVLPKDYVPEITNMMVRRERLLRRVRDIEAREDIRRDLAGGGGPAHFRGIARFLPRTPSAAGGSAGNVNNNNSSGTPAVELQPVSTESGTATSGEAENSTSAPAAGTLAAPGATTSGEASAARMNRDPSQTSHVAPDGARRPDNVSREEWARQRAGDLVGTSETVAQAERRDEARLPGWRRVLGPVFPNLRT